MRNTLAIALLLLLPSVASAYSDADAHLLARACVHESDWYGGTYNDCGGMLQVIEQRRASGETFRSALLRTMPRFARGTTDRPWPMGLPNGPIVRNPAGWAAPSGASVYSGRWERVLARVRSFMSSAEPLPCDARPWHWFSPRTDGRQITDRLFSGQWRVADCGMTRNVFMYRVDVD